MVLAAEAGALRKLAPVLAILLLGLTVAAIIWAAGNTLGYDYEAYARAGRRVLDGSPLYDPTVNFDGPFAVFLYPPPFAVAAIPFAVLPGSLGMWAWTGALLGAFLLGTALLPVRPSIRWAVVALAALDWPFLYSIKLGQVGPFLFLAFAVAWRWVDRPAPTGVSVAAATLIKLQPGLAVVWAGVTRRWGALVWAIGTLLVAAIVTTVLFGTGIWSSYASLLGRINAPITTPHNFTPGAIAYQAGVSEATAGLIQLVSTALAAAVVLFGWLRRPGDASLIVTVVASQFLSPVVWDHYAVVLLLPVAYLLERRQWWAIAIPLACWLPAPVYPVVFWICLVAPLVVGRQATPATRTAVA